MWGVCEVVLFALNLAVFLSVCDQVFDRVTGLWEETQHTRKQREKMSERHSGTRGSQREELSVIGPVSVRAA